MFRSKRDVDKHVQDLLKKTTNENEVCALFYFKRRRKPAYFLLVGVFQSSLAMIQHIISQFLIMCFNLSVSEERIGF